MSVIRFSKAELESVMNSVYSDHKLYIFTESERCMFIEHARHSVKMGFDDSEYEQQMNSLRWFFENVNLANQLQWLKRYKKYGQSHPVTYDSLEYRSGVQLDSLELSKKLHSIRYNSDEFLSKEDSERLDRIIAVVDSRVIEVMERGIKN